MRRVLPFAALLIIAALLVMAFVIYLPKVLVALESSDSWSTHWGDFASVAGVVIGLLGFFLTVLFALKSANAAKAAKEAAISARDGVFAIDAVMELTKAITVLDQTINDHRAESWTTLPPKYSLIRSHLIPLKTVGSPLSEPQRELIVGVLSQIQDLDKRIENALQSGKQCNPGRTGSMLDVLKTQHTKLSEIMAQLRSTNAEVHDGRF